MTVCPIAIAVGCQKCPAFKICPLKGVIGDNPSKSASAPEAKSKPKSKSSAKPRKAAAKK